MKTLLLMRHAKSAWDDAALPDFDRPLAPRGERDAPRMGKFLAAHEFAPNIIVSSPAARAKTTAQKVAAAVRADLSLDERIYLATATELLAVARGIPDSAETALLVGHNPGFEEFVGLLCGVRVRLPTAAIACIELEIARWAEADRGAGVLLWLVHPKLID